MAILKKSVVAVLFGVFVFVGFMVVMAYAEEPLTVSVDGYNFTINDEYLKTLPKNELNELLEDVISGMDTAEPFTQKEGAT